MHLEFIFVVDWTIVSLALRILVNELLQHSFLISKSLAVKLERFYSDKNTLFDEVYPSQNLIHHNLVGELVVLLEEVNCLLDLVH